MVNEILQYGKKITGDWNFSFSGRERLASLVILMPTGIADLSLRSMQSGPEFVTSFGHDIITGFASYHLFKFMGINPKSKSYNAVMGFIMPSTYEISQGLGLWKGTFDWNDFLAYGAGVAIGVGIDLTLHRAGHTQFQLEA